jgi:8-oxo-dGTP diphosphatase
MFSHNRKETAANKLPKAKDPWEKDMYCEKCSLLHFGLGGAAGMLLIRLDTSKAIRRVTDVILQHRSQITSAGGTWGIPGGALNEGEEPAQAALREASEEVGLPKNCVDGSDPMVIVLDECALLDHGAWKYTTVTALVDKPFEPTLPKGDIESLDAKWIPLQDVEKLPLHPDFAKAWPLLKAMLETLHVATPVPPRTWKPRRSPMRCDVMRELKLLSG